LELSPVLVEAFLLLEPASPEPKEDEKLFPGPLLALYEEEGEAEADAEDGEPFEVLAARAGLALPDKWTACTVAPEGKVASTSLPNLRFLTTALRGGFAGNTGSDLYGL
jgi:hypothetical protein